MNHLQFIGFTAEHECEVDPDFDDFNPEIDIEVAHALRDEYVRMEERNG